MSIPILFSPADHSTPQKPRHGGPATHAPGYLVPHRGTLYFRIRVPDVLRHCLGCTEIRRSLGTSSLKDARPKVMKLAAAAHDIFNFARKCLTMRKNQYGEDQKRGWKGFDPESLASLTDEQIREMAKAWLDHSLATQWEGWLLREHSPRDPLEMRDILTSLYADRMYELEGRDYRSIEPEVDEVLLDGGVPHKAAEKSDKGTSPDVPDELARQAQLQYRKLCDAMLRASAALLDASSSPAFDGRLVPNPGLNISMARQVLEAWYSNEIPTPSHFQAGAGHVATAHQPTEAQPTTQGGPSLSVAVQAYIGAKKGEWKASSQNDIPPQLYQFAEVIQKVVARTELPIAALNREHIRGYCEVMYALPKRMQKPEHKGKTYKQLVKLALPEEERLAPKTLATRFTMARSFLNWAAKEYGIDAPRLNDAFRMPKGIKGKRKTDESTRLAFTPAELLQLFNPDHYLEETAKHPSRFWAPLIALFTGMRVSEICRLYLDEIREVDDDEFTAFADLSHFSPRPGEKVWSFDISNRGGGDRPKTPAGERLVPIHPFLIEGLGLLDYIDRVRVQSPSELRLFPEVVPNSKGDVGHAVGTWFTRYRRSLDIGGQAGEISKKVFHSFRHTVIHNLLRVQRVPVQLIQATVGHEEKGADIGETDTYGGDYPITILRDEVILKLGWDKAMPRLAELAASPWAGSGTPGPQG